MTGLCTFVCLSYMVRVPRPCSLICAYCWYICYGRGICLGSRLLYPRGPIYSRSVDWPTDTVVPILCIYGFFYADQIFYTYYVQDIGFWYSIWPVYYRFWYVTIAFTVPILYIWIWLCWSVFAMHSDMHHDCMLCDCRLHYGWAHRQLHVLHTPPLMV